MLAAHQNSIRYGLKSDGLSSFGSKSSVRLYGLIETAKANGIEPYAYLKMIFTKLPQASSLEEIEVLLPVPADAESLAKVS